jgi:hypothetical protein
MEDGEISETGQQFMIHLFEKTGGDSTIQVSMYDIGAIVGLNRDEASKTAEELFGLQLAEIRTLSGGIGISPEGSALVQKLIGPSKTDDGKSVKLGDEPILSPAGQQVVEEIVTELKGQTGALGLDFDALAELMADLKTIDAQMGSPRPKTTIIRECLHSMKALLEGTDGRALYERVNAVLDE